MKNCRFESFLLMISRNENLIPGVNPMHRYWSIEFFIRAKEKMFISKSKIMKVKSSRKAQYESFSKRFFALQNWEFSFKKILQKSSGDFRFSQLEPKGMKRISDKIILSEVSSTLCIEKSFNSEAASYFRSRTIIFSKEENFPLFF